MWTNIAYDGDMKSVTDDTITNHFVLYKDVPVGDPVRIEFDSEHPVTVTQTENGNEITIGGLDKTDENDEPLRYYLVSDEDTYPASEFADPYSGRDHDFYKTMAENIGVNSSVTDKVYEGGSLRMLLFGKTEFSGDLYWTDQSNTSARQNAVNNGEAGDFILYRYVDDEEHIGPHYMDLISQVGTWKINTGNTYLYQYEKKG